MCVLHVCTYTPLIGEESSLDRHEFDLARPKRKKEKNSLVQIGSYTVEG